MREKGNLGELAEPQWGVLKVEQIRAAGVSENRITRMVRDGILHRLYQGVYAFGLRRLPVQGVLLAAQFACGNGAYITGRTALGFAKVRGLFLGRIEVMIPGRRTRHGLPISAQTTKRPPLPGELRHNGPLVFAGVARALLDMALSARGGELDRLITEAIHASRLNHADMRGLINDHAGHPGVARLRDAYAAYVPRPSAKSGLERAFDRALAQRPWIPDPQRNVYVSAGGIDWEIDRYWPDAHLAVELHGGPYHEADPDRAKDELKAAKLIGIGIRMLVVTDRRFELEPDAVCGDLEATLAAAGLLSSRYPGEK